MQFIIQHYGVIAIITSITPLMLGGTILVTNMTSVHKNAEAVGVMLIMIGEILIACSLFIGLGIRMLHYLF